MEDEIKEYVCGFLFFKSVDIDTKENPPVPPTERSVLLILKDRPTWQAGLYNGIGGKVEKGEARFDAMVRECHEECGLAIKDWEYFCLMQGDGYVVHFYKAFRDIVSPWEQKTTESLAAFPVSALPKNLINSNRYLIPMALEDDMKRAIVITQ